MYKIFWKTREGKIIRIEEIEPDHYSNIISWLARNDKDKTLSIFMSYKRMKRGGNSRRFYMKLEDYMKNPEMKNLIIQKQTYSIFN